MAFLIVLLPSHPSLQVFFFAIMQILYFLFFSYLKPFILKRKNILEVANEGLVIIAIYFYITFLFEFPDP